MRTITFDEAIYKLVPIEPTTEMIISGDINLWPTYKNAWDVYIAMLAAVPDTLPGVVVHSGEPFGWFVGHGDEELDFLNFYETEAASQAKESGGVISPLFTHPPAQPDTTCLDYRQGFSDGKASSKHRGIQPDTEALKARITELEAQIAAQAGQEPIAITATYPNGTVDLHWEEGCIDSDWAEMRGGEPVICPLYAAPPAPSNALAIVQAALEAGAKHIEELGRARSEHSGFVSQPVSAATFNYAKAIRALDPQTIIDGMSK